MSRMSGEAAARPRQSLGPRAQIRKPRHRLPPGSTDCHCHTFEAGYPHAADISYLPAPAPLSGYLRMCETVGLERTVQVNSAAFGFDNSVTLDLIKKLGQKRALGVAGIRADAPDAELERLHAGGMRGARLSTKVKGYGGTDLLDALAKKVQPFGWHVDLHLNGAAEIVALEPQLMRLPVPIVFDHMGSPKAAEGVGAPGFQALLRLLKRREDCWVKISSWYRLSQAGAPRWGDMSPLAQALVETRPDRVVWGSNWPHPNRFDEKDLPDDGELVDACFGWVADGALREPV